MSHKAIKGLVATDKRTADVVRRLRKGEELAIVSAGRDGVHFHQGHTLRILGAAFTHYNADLFAFRGTGLVGRINAALAARLVYEAGREWRDSI